MCRMNKVISTIVLTCFLFNTAFSDLAFGLATPLATSDIVGIEYKDMARIKIALEGQLKTIIRPGVTVSRATFQTIFKELISKENTIFHPADMQFFWNEPKHINADSLCYMVRLKDKYGLRTYYATFSFEEDKYGGFPINVFTEKQYNETNAFTKAVPKLKTEDTKTINRYVEQNEKTIDPWIAEHMKYPDNFVEIKYKFDDSIGEDFLFVIYRVNRYPYDSLNSIFEGGISGLLGTLMAQRKIVIIKIKKGEKRPVISEIGKDGKEKKIEVGSHTSQNAVYIFLDEKDLGESEGLSMFENLKKFLLHIKPVDITATSIAVHEYIIFKLFHEMGVALGLDYEITEDGRIINDMDRLYEMAYISHKSKEEMERTELIKRLEKKFSSKDLLANLDHVKGRDYAGGKKRDATTDNLLYNIVNEGPLLRIDSMSTLLEINDNIAIKMAAANSKVSIEYRYEALKKLVENKAVKQLKELKPLIAQLLDDAEGKILNCPADILERVGTAVDALIVIKDVPALESIARTRFMPDSIGIKVSKTLTEIRQEPNRASVEKKSRTQPGPSTSLRTGKSPIDAFTEVIARSEILQSGPFTVNTYRSEFERIMRDTISDSSARIDLYGKGLVGMPSLVKLDLLRKNPNGSLELTENGKQLLEALKEKGEDMVEAVFKILSDSRAQKMLPYMKLNYANMRTFDEETINMEFSNPSAPESKEKTFIHVYKYDAASPLRFFASYEGLNRNSILPQYSGTVCDLTTIINVIQLSSKWSAFESAAKAKAKVTAKSKPAPAQAADNIKNAAALLIKAGATHDLVEHWARLLKEEIAVIVVDTPELDEALNKILKDNNIVLLSGDVETLHAAGKLFEEIAEAMKLLVDTSETAVQSQTTSEPVVVTEQQGADENISPFAVPTEEEEVAAMVSVASEAGLQIPTHPDERYNLLVTSEFFANGELDEHRAKYGDRFDLDRISGTSPEKFVDNILAKAVRKEARTIALVPNDLPPEQLEKLASVGIRFIRVNTTELVEARANKDGNREKFQINTYAMMVLLRQIDSTITQDSSIYRLLIFYLNSHFAFTEKIAIDDYIRAIVNNSIMGLIKGYLAYRPAQAYDTPDYNKVATTLIAA